jgi:hypothetical protein
MSFGIRSLAWLLVGARAFALPLGGQIAVQESKLIASDHTESAMFGCAVAVRGDIALVGAPRARNVNGQWAGAAYVYQRSAGVWNQQLKLVPSDLLPGSEFGIDVAIDGDTAVIGSEKTSSPTHLSVGAAYVFVRSGGVWTQQAKLVPSNAESIDGVGMKVDISGDTVVMGLELADDQLVASAGRVHVFVRSGTTWTEQAILGATPVQIQQGFGHDVAIDGDTIVVGAPDHLEGTVVGGGAFVFTREAGAWTQRAILLGSTFSGVAIHAGDDAGTSVDIDGGTIAIGAPFDNVPMEPNGSVFVFVGSGSSWTEEARLTSQVLGSTAYFGNSLALEGNRIVVGSPHDSQTSAQFAGAMYVFERQGTQWEKTSLLFSDEIDAGRRVGVSAGLDADTVFAGANHDDVTSHWSPGSSFAWRLSQATGFCSGDGSLVTTCPCAPPNFVPLPSAAAGRGCANSLDLDGAELSGSGSLNDAFRLSAEIGANYAGFAVMIKGNGQLAHGSAYGDGIRCVDGAIVRFGGHNAGSNGSPIGMWTYPNAATALPISVVTAQLANETAVYQLVYRDNGASFCSPETMNLSNGLLIFWH